MRIKSFSEKALAFAVAALGLGFGNVLGRTSAKVFSHVVLGQPSAILRVILFPLIEAVGGLGAMGGFWLGKKLLDEHGDEILEQGRNTSLEVRHRLDGWKQQLTWQYSSSKTDENATEFTEMHGSQNSRLSEGYAEDGLLKLKG